MTAAVAAVGKRYLPRGWSHFGLQLAIWFGFLGVYQVARGMAGHDDARARSPTGSASSAGSGRTRTTCSS